MPATPKHQLDSPEVSAAAIRLLAERGENVPSAHELAAAAGMSRSAFFRRFASMSDAVFADHDALLSELETLLSNTPLDPTAAIISGTRRILQHHLDRPETTRMRAEILRGSPALRDRELVVSHRYERVFAAYLVAHSQLAQWEIVALSAGVVAIHNAALRRWLHDQSRQPSPLSSSAHASAELERDLRQLATRFFLPSELETVPRYSDATGNRVLVAVYDSNDPVAALHSIAAQLASAPVTQN